MNPPADTLRAWDKAHLWHPFTPQVEWNASEPLIVDHGDGVYLVDTEGRRYIDGVGSLWCNVHGHRHPALDAAVREQVGRIAHSTMLGLTHAPAIELARQLVERAPDGLTRVFFSDDGATAVEVAIKMAFQYWQQKTDPEPRRTRFVAIEGAYHGDTLGDVSLGGVDRFHKMFSPLLFQAIRAPSPYCYRCPLHLQKPDCGIACLNELDRILGEHPGEVAAVVVEPLVQGAAGIIVHPEGYLKGVREITRKHDTFLIADEVAVGFGKTGKLFACEHEDVVPDFLCIAKGLSGGYLPIAATLTTEEIYRAFYATADEDRTFQHGHTFGGNPLGANVSLANLRVFDEERTLEAMRPRVALLSRKLAEFATLTHVGDVRQCGLIAGIELVADRETKRPFPSTWHVGERICDLARSHGLFIRPIGDVLIVMPPLVINEAQLDEMMSIMITCTKSVTEALP